MNARRLTFILSLLAALTLAWSWPHVTREPTRFEIARRLLEQGRAEDALLLFEDPAWRGVAEYRAGRYTRAIGEFYAGLNTTTLYNIGTSFAQLEEWAGAIAALEQVLRIAPDHDDARYNLKLVMAAAELDSALAVQADKEPQLASGEGAQRTQHDTNKGDPAQRNPGDSNSSQSTTAEAQVDDAGNSSKPGELSEQARTDQAGTAVATGDPDANSPPAAPGVAGSMQLKARESAQAADILLREISDNPAKVLRARLRSAQAARLARLGNRP